MLIQTALVGLLNRNFKGTIFTLRRNLLRTVILGGIALLASPVMGSPVRWRPLGYIPQLECKCGCGQCKMDDDFMRRFHSLRKEWMALTHTDLIPMISSGYRCENHPVEKRKIYGKGPHTRRKAVDIKVSGKKATLLYKISKKYMTGIGVSQRSRRKKSRYIHLDSLSPREARRPTTWVYR